MQLERLSTTPSADPSSVADRADDYDGLAEFHDLFMDEPWEHLRPIVASAFGGLSPSDTIVEVGAGTGMGTRVLASETPASIVALEPNRTMRTALTVRVAADTQLASRVTMVAGGAPESLEAVGGTIQGFVCAHMLGHLTREIRAQTYAALAERLDDDGAGIVTFDSPGLPSDGAVAEQRTMGRYRYEVRHRPSDSSSYISEYLVYDGDSLVRHESFHGAWQRLTLADLRDELSAANLSLTAVGPSVGVVRLRV